MNLRMKKNDELDVNLTPLIDVVFLLLIFFMVSTTFEKEALMHVDLPESVTAPIESIDQPLSITINAEGQYSVNDKDLASTELSVLSTAIAAVAGEQKDLPVLIRADARTPYQAVITAMDVVSRQGLSKVSLATMAAK
ncbi:MAG: biopolymer transporter ExbD [Gammaproteobacteria bacterium]|nr:biopolymer transporter ExbD [Gammaproteobacteria bacterium]